MCSTKLLQTPIVLGGPGVVVQADESQFKHKPIKDKVVYYEKSVWFHVIVINSIIEVEVPDKTCGCLAW